MPNIRPRFDGTVQFGHIIQAVVLAVGILGTWINMKIQVDIHAKDLARHDQEIRQLHKDDQSIRDTQNRLSDNLIRLTAIIEERTHHVP